MLLERIAPRKIFLLIGDVFIIILSFYIAIMIRVKIFPGPLLGERFPSLLFLFIAYLVSFYVFGLYDLRLSFRKRRSVYLLLASFLLTSFFAMIFFYLFPFKLKRGIFFISLVLIAVLVYIWRLFYSYIFRMAVPRKRILIVGSGEPAEEIFSLLKKNQDYEAIGFVSDNPMESKGEKIQVMGDSGSIEEIVKTNAIDEIILSVNPDENSRLSRGLINCKVLGISIYDMARFYEHLESKLPVPFVKEQWILYGAGFNRIGSKVYMRIKRVLDLFLSSVLLVCFFPVGVLLALLIRLDSRGPIFFTQERLGKHFVPFKIIKLRTMVFDAEKGKPQWAGEKDPRVTKVGRILRKIRLDEVPQLFNIIRGDMSFIGPRPERKYFVRELKKKIPYYSLRFSVKPGLTGWAQVNYRYGASEKDSLEKLRYELFYIKNMSFPLDFRIMLRTIRIVLFGMGR